FERLKIVADVKDLARRALEARIFLHQLAKQYGMRVKINHNVSGEGPRAASSLFTRRPVLAQKSFGVGAVAERPRASGACHRERSSQIAKAQAGLDVRPANV